ncbi:hypothetical protein OsJ_23100 [Oryza sativa Japonica Group]|uniref:Uncharacterized protein n=1 Tax=Oryza sativa subsp. japonica TaxID=39947 RepID=A3BGL1_ORYSJ|nr:hypothetical protein OsJ_23100 [Oryza sativa Japonica Group]
MLGFIAGRLRRPSTLLTVLRPGPAAAATKRSIHHQLVDRQTKNAPSAAAGCIWATTVAGSCSKAGPAAPKLPLLPGNTPTLRSPSAAAGCSWGLANAAAATGPKSTALAAVCSRGPCNRRLRHRRQVDRPCCPSAAGASPPPPASRPSSPPCAPRSSGWPWRFDASWWDPKGPTSLWLAWQGSTGAMVPPCRGWPPPPTCPSWRRLHLLLRPRVLTVKASKAVKDGAGDLGVYADNDIIKAMKVLFIQQEILIGKMLASYLEKTRRRQSTISLGFAGMQVLVCTFVAVRFEGATPAEAIYKNLSYLEVFFKTSLLAVGDAVKLWVQQQPSHDCDINDGFST